MSDPTRDLAPLGNSNTRSSAEAQMSDDPLVSTTAGDRCSSCGSPLSSDQRYCVVCGERRGAARFGAPSPAPAAGGESPADLPAPAPARNGRFGAGVTIVAGVFTLLLAMLIGVLIGHNSAGGVKTIAQQQRPIIKVVGAGAAAPAATSPSTTASGSSSTGGGGGSSAKKHGSKTASHSSTTKAPSAATAAKQSAAASKVTGGTHTVPSTQTIGSSCSTSTAGCNPKTHKQDGSFFGG